MESIKRQVLPSGLWVVATPIGNLGDLSARTRQALEDAPVILCEDTRRTLQLLSALGMSGKRLERLDAHAPVSRLEFFSERLVAGETFALVSDAGTPAVSDPGAELVALALKKQVTVTPIPGPSAVLTLLSVSGFSETAFVFRGFFHRKAKERLHELEAVRRCVDLQISRVFVWFESPERIVDALDFLAQQEPSSKLVVGKELTKFHERLFAGEASEVQKAVADEVLREGARGEWCFALLLSRSGLAQMENERENISNSSEWVKSLKCLLNVRVSASEAAREVSQQFGIPKKQVYEAALKLSGKKVSQGG
ncbi:16S rRNA (cytidine(1402)-2'-O)-methyltransferase [Bdellovibrionota bacterium FG-1]